MGRFFFDHLKFVIQNNIGSFYAKNAADQNWHSWYWLCPRNIITQMDITKIWPKMIQGGKDIRPFIGHRVTE